MTDDEVPSPIDRPEKKSMTSSGASAVYGLGFVGAAVYYIQHATTFWAGVLGFFKALVRVSSFGGDFTYDYDTRSVELLLHWEAQWASNA